ncbi:MAG TPA: hydrogenase subunit MbhD domain-containing protein [Pirellulales bacterium]|jgi:uncharacterized MnhB-related membrane protein|nr:hydrogenase subunit MbhD domain-containing protein [Pirellulales bacterium]
MSGTLILLGVHLLFLAILGPLVVAARDPRRQACVTGLFALVQASLFFLLRAPDVALSELVVGTVGVPGMLLFTLSMIEGTRE